MHEAWIDWHGAQLWAWRAPAHFAHNGSGDYVIAFSTARSMRRPRSSRQPEGGGTLVNEAMSPLFAATAEATEEAIYNAILKATTVKSSRGKLVAIPLDELTRILKKYRCTKLGQVVTTTEKKWQSLIGSNRQRLPFDNPVFQPGGFGHHSIDSIKTNTRPV